MDINWEDYIHLSDDDNELIDEPVDEGAAHRLRTLYERLTNHRENALRPGQLAMWKPGLKNRRFPAYGQPVIVVERLDPPILDHEEEAGVTYIGSRWMCCWAFCTRTAIFSSSISIAAAFSRMKTKRP